MSEPSPKPPHKPQPLAELCDSHQAIAQQYKCINQLVSKSHNTFQRLYNKKQRLLLEGLHTQLEAVRRELKYYESVTSPEYIRQKCQEKKEELQQQRFEMLRRYMEITNELIEMRKVLRDAQQKLEETRIDKKNTQEMLRFLTEESDMLLARDELRRSEISAKEAVFATEPCCGGYVSPYAKSRLLKDVNGRGQHKKRKLNILQFRTVDPVLQEISRLYRDKESCKQYTRDDELNFALSVLDLPEIRQNIIDILTAKR